MCSPSTPGCQLSSETGDLLRARGWPRESWPSSVMAASVRRLPSSAFAALYTFMTGQLDLDSMADAVVSGPPRATLESITRLSGFDV